MIKLTPHNYDGAIYVNPCLITAMEARKDVHTGNVTGTIIYFDQNNEVMVKELVDDVAKLIPGLI